MLKLKMIPRFARILSSGNGAQLQSARVLSRAFASGDDGGGNDGDFFASYLSQPDRTPQSRRPSQSSGFARQGSRFAGRGRGGGFTGRGGGTFMGRGGPPGPRRRFDYIDDDVPTAPITEEDIQLKAEIDKKREEEKREEALHEEDVEAEEEQKSVYAGFIDPKYDDVAREQKMHLKRLKYKDKAVIPSRFADQDNEEDLSYLDRDSDEENMQGRRSGGVDMRGQAVIASDDESALSEDEVDEEEWEIMNEMNNEEFENHLRHRENAKQLSKEYDERLQALGDDPDDEEVKKLQKLMMKKWRAHYLMPRMVMPKEKEEMWQKHKEDPEVWTVDKLAEEYNVCKARVHAILFLWDIRKYEGESQTAEEETRTYLDNLCFDEWGKPCLPPHMGEDKWVTTWNTKPNYKIMPADWEGSVRSEEEAIEEASAKEEAMMLEEFVRRLEFNKLQMAGLMKQNRYERRRPAGGWTYLIEKLGPEGKRGKRGGFRFVATADGKHRKLNELEKLVLKREAVRPRKRMI